LKFIADNKIELSPDLLEGASGGGGEGIDTGCQHKWKFIGRKKGVPVDVSTLSINRIYYRE